MGVFLISLEIDSLKNWLSKIICIHTVVPSQLRKDKLVSFPSFPNMLAAATVNGFQFSLLVLSLEQDSPITKAAPGRYLGVRLFLKRQLLGPAS